MRYRPLNVKQPSWWDRNGERVLWFCSGLIVALGASLLAMASR